MKIKGDRFRFGTAGVAVCALAAAMLSACTSTETGGNTLSTAQESKSIRVGIANEQPYGFADASGNVTGQAPEVARAAFRAMGIDNIQANVVPFDQLIPALNAGQFDVVSAGMFITPARCQQASFSVPDYTTKAALIVPAGNPRRLNTFADVAAQNARLAVVSAAVEKGYAEAAGIRENNIVTLDNQDNLLRSVADGRVDAAALTDISLQWLVKQNPGVPVEVTPSFTPKDQSGRDVVSAGAFVFRNNDNDLRDAFNQQLQQLHSSGEWVRLAEPFGFSEANLPAAGMTTDRFCNA